MGTDIDIYRGSSLEARMRYASTIAEARGLLPAGVVTAPQALLIFEQASALGIPPITGLSNIHVIKGRPTLSAGLMTGLIRQAGHKIRVWVEGEGDKMKAIAELVRSDDPDFTFRVEYTIDDAKLAGLHPGKEDSNWRKYPRAMLKARATSEVAREAATDVFIGSIYTPEELDPSVEVDEQGEMIATPTAQMSNLTPETTESSDITAPDMPAEVRQQWFDTAAKLKTYKAIQAFYKDIKQRGYLHIALDDDPEVTLEKYVIAKGKQAAAAEGVPAKDGARPEADQQTGEVIDAEIVEDEDEGPAAVLDPEIAEPPAEAPKKRATGSRTRKPANAAEAGAGEG